MYTHNIYYEKPWHYFSLARTPTRLQSEKLRFLIVDNFNEDNYQQQIKLNDRREQRTYTLDVLY